jgi:hypothetical protein
MHFTIEQVDHRRNLHEFHHFNDPRGPIKVAVAAGPRPRALGVAEEAAEAAPQISISRGPTGRGFTQARTRVAGNNVGVSQAPVAAAAAVAPVAALSKWEARANPRGIRKGGKRRITRKHRQRRKGKKSRKSRKSRQ